MRIQEYLRLVHLIQGPLLAHSDRWIMVPESGHWQTTKDFQRLSALAEKKTISENNSYTENLLL